LLLSGKGDRSPVCHLKGERKTLPSSILGGLEVKSRLSVIKESPSLLRKEGTPITHGGGGRVSDLGKMGPVKIYEEQKAHNRGKENQQGLLWNREGEKGVVTFSEGQRSSGHPAKKWTRQEKPQRAGGLRQKGELLTRWPENEGARDERDRKNQERPFLQKEGNGAKLLISKRRCWL